MFELRLMCHCYDLLNVLIFFGVKSSISRNIFISSDQTIRNQYSLFLAECPKYLIISNSLLEIATWEFIGMQNVSIAEIEKNLIIIVFKNIIFLCYYSSLKKMILITL